MATYADARALALVAGHPALDLVNTVEPRVGEDAPHEHLRAPADLLVWAQRTALLDEVEAASEARAWEGQPQRGVGALARVVEAREASYELLSAVVSAAPTVPAEPLAILQRNWAEAAARSELRGVTGTPTPCELIVGVSPGLIVLDRISQKIVELVTDVDLTSMRACPAEDGGCGWLFLDRSRSGSRRWCVMSDCGTKAKARRLTERRRADRRR